MVTLGECGFRRVTAFTSAKEAYEVASRQQFAAFVTRMEMPDMSGIVLIQKLRQCGNYGLEPHLFICDKLDSKLLSVTAENDLDYVLVAPLTKPAIAQKFKHLLATENALSSQERLYRDAKSAFRNGILEMAEELVRQVLAETPALEKALLLHGDILAQDGKRADARELYKRALHVNPKSASAAHKLAQLMMAEGDHGQAAELLNRLAALSPYNIKLLENAGLSNFNVQRYEEAKGHMASLGALDESNKAAATVTAQIKIKTGDFDGLVQSLSKSHTEKELIQFLNNAGAKLSQDNDIEGALRMYQAAVAQIQDSKFLYAIHYNIGIAYKKKQQLDAARTHFEASLKVKPDFEKAATALAELRRAAA
jgi:tetratricopeptide (TPR) repeat protein